MKTTPAQQAKKNADAKKELITMAKEVVQLSALRLETEKREKELKTSIERIMLERGFDVVDDTVLMDKRKVTIEISRVETSVSSIDVGKISEILTPEQFKQCATVTLTAARSVLPQALVDKCIVAGTPRVSCKVKASQGFPVPTVNLFK